MQNTYVYMHICVQVRKNIRSLVSCIFHELYYTKDFGNRSVIKHNRLECYSNCRFSGPLEERAKEAKTSSSSTLSTLPLFSSSSCAFHVSIPTRWWRKSYPSGRKRVNSPLLGSDSSRAGSLATVSLLLGTISLRSRAPPPRGNSWLSE